LKIIHRRTIANRWRNAGICLAILLDGIPAIVAILNPPSSPSQAYRVQTAITPLAMLALIGFLGLFIGTRDDCTRLNIQREGFSLTYEFKST
jgi:hypothetical protein